MNGLFGLALVLLSPAFGQEPYKPQPNEIATVQAAIDKAAYELDEVKNSAYQVLWKDKSDIEVLLGLRRNDPQKTLVEAVSDAEFDSWPDWKRALHRAAGHTTYGEVAKKLAKLPVEKREEYADLLNRHKKFQERSHQLHQEAIGVAMEVYRISPKRGSGPIESGPPVRLMPDGSPDPRYEKGYIGSKAEWNPKYAPNMPEGERGRMDYDGSGHIGPDAFAYPGRLAYALYHEASHFDELLTKDLDLRNNPGWEAVEREEHRPYLKEHFGFTDEDIANFDKKLAVEKSRALQWEAVMREGYDPFTEAHRSVFPMENYKSRKWFDESDALTLLEIMKNAGAFRERKEWYEEERRARRKEVERQKQEEARRSKKEAYQKLVDKMDYDLARCDFEPLWKYTDDTGRQYLWSFQKNKKKWKGEETDWAYYRFADKISDNQIQVSLLFTWSCLAVNDNFSLKRACNDGLKIADENWHEKEFKEGIIPDGSPNMHPLQKAYEACMDYLIENFEPNTGFDGFQRLLDKAQEDHRNTLKRDWQERERAYRKHKKRRKTKPRKPRSGRERDDDPKPPWYPPCMDSRCVDI